MVLLLLLQHLSKKSLVGRIPTLRVCRLRYVTVVWSNSVACPSSITCLVGVEVSCFMSSIGLSLLVVFHIGACNANIFLIRVSKVRQLEVRQLSFFSGLAVFL